MKTEELNIMLEIHKKEPMVGFRICQRFWLKNCVSNGQGSLFSLGYMYIFSFFSDFRCIVEICKINKKNCLIGWCENISNRKNSYADDESWSASIQTGPKLCNWKASC